MLKNEWMMMKVECQPNLKDAVGVNYVTLLSRRYLTSSVYVRQITYQESISSSI